MEDNHRAHVVDPDWMAEKVIEGAKRERYGFLTKADVEIIAASPAYRLTPCLVRCGCGRFTCAAQDVEHFIGIINRDYEAQTVNKFESDYVRDVSLPAER
jgi:hypothetical protein